MKQETLIFVEDQDKINAGIMAKGFANKDVLNRAYFNTIGVSIVSRYLASENINVENLTGLHSIKKVLEEVDVSDIILPNIRIDVRVVFDKNIIFVPKSHFEYNIVPDIYVVIKPDEDLSSAELLGFFEPSLINKNNVNDKYYFIEKEKLTPCTELINYIKSCNHSTTTELSEDELELSEQVIMAFSDNDISEDTKKYLISQLIKSPKLRDKYIEYENFETLSYKAMTDPMIDVPNLPQDTTALDEFEIFDSPVENDIESDFELTSLNESDETQENLQETIPDEITEETSEEKTDEKISGTLENIDVIDENVLDNIGEITDLAGAAAGFEAISEVQDSMKDILFDDETVEAIDSIDKLNSDNQENPNVNDIDEEVNIETIDTNSAELDADNNAPLFEPLDTAEVENITESSENALSFDDIIVPENVEELDTSNEEPEINNSLSFDDIIVPENVEELDTNNAEPEINNSLSFDDIIVPENIDEPDTNNAEPEINNSLSFDDIIVPENIEEPDTNNEEPEINNSLSFDDIIVPENVEELDTSKAEPEINNSMSFDDVIIPDDVAGGENVENVSNELPIDDVIIPDDVIGDENTEDVVDKLPFDDVITPEDIEANNLNNAFGKNLLENLNEENLDNIVIENSDAETGENEDSDELLAQIDDVLSLSAQLNSAETPKNEEYDDNQNDEITDQNEFLITGNQDSSQTEENKLDVLYNEQAKTNSENELEEISDFEEENYPAPSETEEKPQKTVNKKTKIAAAVLIAVFVGITAITFLKPKNNASNMDDTIANNAMNQETNVTNNNNIDTDNINQNNNILESNVPQEVKTEQTQQVDKSKIQEMKNDQINKPSNISANMNITKLVWDVPAALSSDKNMETYLKSTGKSIKLSLSTDLLLASEYAYTNLVKVNMTLNANGSIGGVKIASSSGSQEIDNIVLQSVNNTLKAMKPPRTALNGQAQQLTLIIYF